MGASNGEVQGRALAHGLPLAAGNQAVARAVQRRRTRRQDRVWLRDLLTDSDPIRVSTGLAAAATRVAGWSDGRRASIVGRLRGEVDGFEVRLGSLGLLGDADARRMVGLLEGAQPTAALGTRLVTLFQASVAPEMGLVVADQVPVTRLRAALGGQPDAERAIAAVQRRNPVAGLGPPLAQTHGLLGRIAREMRSPSSAGLHSPTPGDRARVVELLTPEEVRQERAAAAAAGAPAPAFESTGYYPDLLVALHTTMLDHWPSADRWDRARSMDTTAGGHVEGIATEAKARVDALFGSFGSAAAPSLTFAGGNLADQTTSPGDPRDMARWFIENSGAEAVSSVQDDHNSFEDATASQLIEASVIDHYAGRSAPSVADESAALAALGMSTAERQRRLTVIDRMWGGMAQGGNVSIRAREGTSERHTRSLYWGLFKTIIHEYLHTTEHADYQAWYGRLTDFHHQTTFQEGVTDLFTHYTWQSVFPDEIANNAAFRRRIQGTSRLDMRAVGGPPGHYDELEQAMDLEGVVGLANLRAAYFRGQTNLLAGAGLPGATP